MINIKIPLMSGYLLINDWVVIYTSPDILIESPQCFFITQSNSQYIVSDHRVIHSLPFNPKKPIDFQTVMGFIAIQYGLTPDPKYPLLVGSSTKLTNRPACVSLKSVDPKIARKE